MLGWKPKGTAKVIQAQVPMAEVLNYAPDLRSMTSGRGSFDAHFSHYDEVPGPIAEKGDQGDPRGATRPPRATRTLTHNLK